MDPQRWAQIKELFHRACECGPAQRSRLLEECGSGDPELRRTVEALLASEEGAANDLQAAVHSGLDAVAFPLVGDTISHYRILAGIGTGGMGSVYRAEDIRLGREVALKFLAEEFASDSAALGRFEREARSASALEHPNICPVYEFGELAGQPFLVMPLLQGETLRELLARSAPAPLETHALLALSLQIASALDAAHRHGIIHRDIKPANIFITTQGEAKILDFGLAKAVHSETAEDESRDTASGRADDDGGFPSPRLTPEASLTSTGFAIGTSAYMSPEQACGEKLDARTDIFSFGLVLYEMATGQRAFQGATEPIVRDLMLGQKPPEARLLNPALPARLEAIIDKALKKDRHGRYATAADLRADLAAVKQAAEGRGARRLRLFAAAAAVVLMIGAVAVTWFFTAAHRTAPLTPAVAKFAPPPHSIAVLPFVNLSGDASQDYFSEGLTEELLNSLAQINNLQVAARTSSFSFKEHPEIGTVARKLNVGAVLEGSVRRSAHTVRVTAQLINTVTGFHLWSKTYDRDLGDVLRLQTEIATAVAGALQVTLLGDEAAKIELGGTRTAAAFDAYLRASKVYSAAANARDTQDAVTGYTEAIRLDPNYALAYAARSLAFASFATHYATGPAAVRASLDRAEIDAHKAIAVAPDLGPGHLALAVVFERLLDFRLAKEEYERALELDPGSARTLSNWGFFAVLMGHTDVGLTAERRAVTLDPLNPNYYRDLGVSLQFAGRGDEAMAVFRSGQRVDPDYALINAGIGILEYFRGNFESARTTCEHLGGSEFDVYLVCLAITYDKLGRRGDAEASLAKLKAARGDAAASMYVRIYAQWGNRKQALDWLEMAMRLRDPELEYIKVVPLIDPLRQEPRFQAVERALKFPD